MSTHRSFTVRVPTPIYIEIASSAQADGMTLNAKANQLLRLALEKYTSLDTALRVLLEKQQ